jgi:hypothetical protein
LKNQPKTEANFEDCIAFMREHMLNQAFSRFDFKDCGNETTDCLHVMVEVETGHGVEIKISGPKGSFTDPRTVVMFPVAAALEYCIPKVIGGTANPFFRAFTIQWVSGIKEYMFRIWAVDAENPAVVCEYTLTEPGVAVTPKPATPKARSPRARKTATA